MSQIVYLVTLRILYCLYEALQVHIILMQGEKRNPTNAHLTRNTLGDGQKQKAFLEIAPDHASCHRCQQTLLLCASCRSQDKAPYIHVGNRTFISQATGSLAHDFASRRQNAGSEGGPAALAPQVTSVRPNFASAGRLCPITPRRQRAARLRDRKSVV